MLSIKNSNVVKISSIASQIAERAHVLTGMLIFTAGEPNVVTDNEIERINALLAELPRAVAEVEESK